MFSSIHVDRKSIQRLTRIIAFIVLAFAFGYIQKVNYQTTYLSLTTMFGFKDWVQAISIAVVLIDAASIARAFTTEKNLANEPTVVQTLMYLWIGTSLVDGLLNWYFAAIEILPGFETPYGIGNAEYIAPVAVALIIWGLQFGITYFFGVSAENMFDDLGVFRKPGGQGAQKPFQPPPQNNQGPQPSLFGKPKP